MDIAVMPYALSCEWKMTKAIAILRRSFRRASAGFSVVELVILTAVISVLCAIGFPLYLSYSRAQETDSAPRVLLVSLNQARQLAVTRGLSYSVETPTNPNNRMPVCSANAPPCPTAIVTVAPT